MGPPYRANLSREPAAVDRSQAGAREAASAPSPIPGSPRLALRFQVRPADELPIYRQIERQVIAAIAGGKLKPGDQLPSHRDLSQALVIAPLTVKKAYDELELSGYIATVRGQGTFVSEGAQRLDDREKLVRLEAAVHRLVHEAALLGVDVESLVRLVRSGARTVRETARGEPEKANKKEEIES